MKPNKFLGAFLAISLGLAPMVGAMDVHAQASGKLQGKGKVKGKKDSPASLSGPAPTTTKPIGWVPANLTWGLDQKDVIKVIDQLLEKDYKPLFKKAQPGVGMRALEAALAEEKSTFRRSLVRFGKLPTGYDATPLKGEYTYQNKESMMSLTRKGQTRYFFFIDKKF